MKVNGQWVPCVRNFSYSFMPIHLKLYLCNGHGLKICGGLDIILGLFFCHFFSQFELGHFFGHFSEWIKGTLFAELLQFNTILKLYRFYDHALKICM